MITLRKIYTLFFLIGIFYIPFNEFEGIPILGEYKNEAATYFFLIGFFVVLIESLLQNKLNLPIRSIYFKILILLIGWILFTAIYNYSSISQNYFKQISGFNRFLRQFISFLISAVIFTTLFWNVTRGNSLNHIFTSIRRVMWWSLIFVFVYGFIEILIVVFGFYKLTPLLRAFDIFPFVNTNFEAGRRISSISYEVPALGNYLITIAGWMFSYVLTSKNFFKRFIPTFIVFFLMFFSGSRAALIVITFQFIIFVLILLSERTYRKKVLFALKKIVPVIFIIFILKGPTIKDLVFEKINTINFYENLNKNISNKTRFGMQYASLCVFVEHPIFGVGLGQETYHKRKYYPYWAKHNNYEFPQWYENQSLKSFPPAFNIYTRLLAEIGFIGFTIFISLIFLTLYGSYFYLKRSFGVEKAFASILLVSFVGLSINWLQTDFFRQYGFWLCLVLLIDLKRKVVLKKINLPNNNK